MNFFWRSYESPTIRLSNTWKEELVPFAIRSISAIGMQCGYENAVGAVIGMPPLFMGTDISVAFSFTVHCRAHCLFSPEAVFSPCEG